MVLAVQQASAPAGPAAQQPSLFVASATRQLSVAADFPALPGLAAREPSRRHADNDNGGDSSTPWSTVVRHSHRETRQMSFHDAYLNVRVSTVANTIPTRISCLDYPSLQPKRTSPVLVPDLVVYIIRACGSISFFCSIPRIGLGGLVSPSPNTLISDLCGLVPQPDLPLLSGPTLSHAGFCTHQAPFPTSHMVGFVHRTHVLSTGGLPFPNATRAPENNARPLNTRRTRS